MYTVHTKGRLLGKSSAFGAANPGNEVDKNFSRNEKNQQDKKPTAAIERFVDDPTPCCAAPPSLLFSIFLFDLHRFVRPAWYEIRLKSHLFASFSAFQAQFHGIVHLRCFKSLHGCAFQSVSVEFLFRSHVNHVWFHLSPEVAPGFSDRTARSINFGNPKLDLFVPVYSYPLSRFPCLLVSVILLLDNFIWKASLIF